MGRKRLNRTSDEIREQNRIRGNRFYGKHKERIRHERMEKYWKDKRNIQNN